MATGFARGIWDGYVCEVSFSSENQAKIQNTKTITIHNPKHKFQEVLLGPICGSSQQTNVVFGRISQRSFDPAHHWLEMATSKFFDVQNISDLAGKWRFFYIFTTKNALFNKTQKCVLCFVSNIFTKHKTQNTHYKTQNTKHCWPDSKGLIG